MDTDAHVRQTNKNSVSVNPTDPHFSAYPKYLVAIFGSRCKKKKKPKVFVGFFGQELFKVSTWSYINIPHNIFFPPHPGVQLYTNDCI